MCVLTKDGTTEIGVFGECRGYYGSRKGDMEALQACIFPMWAVHTTKQVQLQTKHPQWTNNHWQPT